MSELTEHIRGVLDRNKWSLREGAEQLGMNKGTLESILKPNTTPRLETLQELARALRLPLWRVVQMAGVNLDLPMSADERAARLASLAKEMPQYQKIVDHLLDLDPADTDGILMHLEGIALRRQARSEDRL